MNKNESLASSDKSYGFLHAQKSRKENSMGKLSQTETGIKHLRILLPINAEEDSRWGIQYALRLQNEGKSVEVVLLHIGEPVTQWQVLRFRTQQEIAEFQAARAEAYIEDASQALNAAGIQNSGLFRQGELVFTILDTAEEQDCDEIVMPDQKSFLHGVFGHGIVAAVQRHQRSIPVVIVNSEGDSV